VFAPSLKIEQRKGANTMPLVTRVVFVPDDFDLRMREDGYVSDIEASEELGRSLDSIPSMIRCGALSATTFRGRTYIATDSISRVIRAVGVPSAREQRLEHLESTGRQNVQEAVCIREAISRTLAEETVCDGTAGIWGGRSDVSIIRNARPVQADEQNPITVMRAKYAELVKRSAKGGK
jgi:hypothetical protein